MLGKVTRQRIKFITAGHIIDTTLRAKHQTLKKNTKLGPTTRNCANPTHRHRLAEGLSSSHHIWTRLKATISHTSFFPRKTKVVGQNVFVKNACGRSRWPRLSEQVSRRTATPPHRRRRTTCTAQPLAQVSAVPRARPALSRGRDTPTSSQAVPRRDLTRPRWQRRPPRTWVSVLHRTPPG